MKSTFLTFSAALLCAYLVILAGSIKAQDAMFIDANGRVGLSASGQSVADGMYTLVLSIWDDTTGGNMLWSETHLVQTKDGLWNATLGGLTPLPVDVMAPDTSGTVEARFLQMEFDGEIIEPRRRMGGLPFAGVSQRLRGDIITSPGKLELRSPEEMSSGMSVELEVTEDSFGDPEARMSFFSTDASRASSKPKEIVVVGSKVKEVVRFFENDMEDEVATREYVKGRATGERRYPPFKVTGAVLPDTIPAYDLSVDSSGSNLSMSKNNTDGSSCWIRVAQNNSGSSFALSSSNGSSSTETVDARDYLVWQRHTHGHSSSGDSSSISEKLTVDSSYSKNIVQVSGTSAKKAVRATALKALKDLVQGNVFTDSMHLTDGSSSSHHVDARDYALWRSNYGTSGGGSSAQVSEMISVDSGYKHELTMTDGTTTTSDVDGRDFLIWQRGYSSTNSSGQAAAMSHSIGIDTGFNQSILMSDASGNQAELTHVVQQSGGEAAAISSLRTLVTTQALFSETKLDSSGSSWLLQAEDNIIARAGKRLTKAEVITELTSSSSSNEFSDDDNNTLVQSEATTTSSKLFVGGLSWDGVAGEDGVEVHATNGRKTVRAHDFIAASTDTGSAFELSVAEDTSRLQLRSGEIGGDGFLDIAAASGSSGLSMKGGNFGVYQSSIGSNTAGSSLKFSQILPSRAIADMIALEHTSTSSKLYVGNLGFGSNDGVNIISDFSAGARIGIGTNAPGVALHVIGSICYTGGITSCSDGRYKEDIETIDDALDIIEHLRGVEYKWKRDEFPHMRFSGGRQLGLVAQEVKEVLPELVTADADGYYSVDYVKLTPLLVEAIKAQQKTIEELKQKVADSSELNERISQLEKLVSRFANDN